VVERRAAPLRLSVNMKQGLVIRKGIAEVEHSLRYFLARPAKFEVANPRVNH